MKFGGFKIGKSKGTNTSQEEEVAEITEDLLQNIEQDGVPARPHAPLQELALDAGGGGGGPDEIPVDEVEGAAEDDAEAIKLVEVQADPTTPPDPATPVTPTLSTEQKKEQDKLDLATSIGDIFNNIEDEENPLANLVKALPDVAATELLDDLKEINDIIKDWQKK